MKTRVRLTVIAVLVVAGTWWWWLGRDGGETDGGLFASGTVEATDADLGFQMAGRVGFVSVAEGERVTRGDELARLDARELEAALGAAAARLAAARAQLAELTGGSRPQELATAESALGAATKRVDEARRDAERARALFEGGAVSQQFMQRAQTALDIAIADEEQAAQRVALVREGPRSEAVDAQRSLVELARAEVALAEARLAYTVIVAPFDGVVTVRHREPGESVAAGAPVVTLLDPHDRWVRIYVRGDAIGRVHVGLTARIRSDTYPERGYEGEVAFVGSEAEFTPRNVQTTEERTTLVYPVKVRITGDPENVLKPGVPADVTIVEG
jgi:HlyD family secretion protein